VTALTPEEREKYAKPGTLLRKMLDDGVVPWPTREELIYEVRYAKALGIMDIGVLLGLMEGETSAEAEKQV
jgi:hypothetical protein